MSEKTKKILVLLGEINRGGVEMTLLRSLETLKETGQLGNAVDVHLMRLDDIGERRGVSESDFENLGVKIHRPKVLKNIPILSSDAKKVIKNGNFDAIHSTMFRANPLLDFAKKESEKSSHKIVTISHSHRALPLDFQSFKNSPEQVFSALIFKKAGERADKKVAVSASAAIAAFGEEAFNSNQVQILPNPVLSNRVFGFSKNSRKSIRDSFSLSEKDLVVGFAGRLVPQKNIDFLIILSRVLEEFPIIGKDGETLKVKFLFIGDGVDRPKAELFGSVTGNFSAETVSEFLSALDVFLMPSHFEGLPTSLIEAQANGLPSIVSSRVDEFADLQIKSAPLKFLPIGGETILKDGSAKTVKRSEQDAAKIWRDELEKVAKSLPDDKTRKTACTAALKSKFEVSKATKELLNLWLNA